jgi:hypothetical protein
MQQEVVRKARHILKRAAGAVDLWWRCTDEWLAGPHGPNAR